MPSTPHVLDAFPLFPFMCNGRQPVLEIWGWLSCSLQVWGYCRPRETATCGWGQFQPALSAWSCNHPLCFPAPHSPSARLPIPTAGCSEIPFHSPFQRREEFVPESNQQSIPFFNKKIYREFNCLHCSVGCTILQLISKGSHSLSYFILILITHQWSICSFIQLLLVMKCPVFSVDQLCFLKWSNSAPNSRK